MFQHFKTFMVQKWRLGGVYVLALWYVLISTQLLFVMMDAVGPVVVVEQTASHCAAKGCGCDVTDLNRICCCTGKTVGESHGAQFEPIVSDVTTTLSYLAASFCAGNFPDEDGLKSARSLHVLANAPLLLLTLVFLFFLPLSSSNFSSWKVDPPDKIPIVFS